MRNIRHVSCILDQAAKTKLFAKMSIRPSVCPSDVQSTKTPIDRIDSVLFYLKENHTRLEPIHKDFRC